METFRFYIIGKTENSANIFDETRKNISVLKHPKYSTLFWNVDGIPVLSLSHLHKNFNLMRFGQISDRNVLDIIIHIKPDFLHRRR